MLYPAARRDEAGQIDDGETGSRSGENHVDALADGLGRVQRRLNEVSNIAFDPSLTFLLAPRRTRRAGSMFRSGRPMQQLCRRGHSQSRRSDDRICQARSWGMSCARWLHVLPPGSTRRSDPLSVSTPNTSIPEARRPLYIDAEHAPDA